MNYNYFMTLGESTYWKTFGRNIVIGIGLLFFFYAVTVVLTDRYPSELLVKILWTLFIIIPSGLIVYKFYRRFRK